MLSKCYYKLIYIVGFLQLYYCQRRLASEIDSITGKKYMVYFVQSPFTKNFQSSWVCGGALVSSTQILTAANCLIETGNIYAIAGYRKYINAKNIDNDECTRTKKQRVVKILLPTVADYETGYDNAGTKINIDIGVAIVETPYKFNDLSYLTYCSYKPQPIIVNYDNNNELENTNAVALGWGVKSRTLPLTAPYQLLQEKSTMIVHKKICTDIFNDPDIVHIINKYHLCVSINLQELEKHTNHETESFDVYQERLREHNHGSFNKYFGYRRSNDEDNTETKRQKQILDVSSQNYTKTNNEDYTRKEHLNICQYNLGSPLVKFLHNREILIGVTSSMKGGCNGPFVYVSTAASSKIINCLLETDPFIRKLCNLQINGEPHEIHEIDIHWPNYQQSKLLEPLLLVQRAVLDEIQQLKPRATLSYGLHAENPTKQQLYKSPYEQSGHLYQQPQNVYATYLPKFKHQEQLTYNPLSEHNTEQLKTQYVLRPDFPYQFPLRYYQPPQYMRYDSKLHQPSPLQTYDRKPEEQYIPQNEYELQSRSRQLPSGYRQQHGITGNEKYVSTGEQYEQQLGRYGIATGIKHHPVIAQEDGLRQQNKQSSNEQLSSALKVSNIYEIPRGKEYNTSWKGQIPYRQPDSQMSHPIQLPPDPYLESLHLEPLDNHAKNLTFEQAELLYDLSHEYHSEAHNTKLIKPQLFGSPLTSIQNRQDEFSNTQQSSNRPPQIEQIEPQYYEKSAVHSNPEKLSNDQFLSFGQIFTQRQGLAFESTSQNTRANSDEFIQKLFGQALEQHKDAPNELMRESIHQLNLYQPTTTIPEIHQVMIRPQVPVNNVYDTIVL